MGFDFDLGRDYLLCILEDPPPSRMPSKFLKPTLDLRCLRLTVFDTSGSMSSSVFGYDNLGVLSIN